MTSLRDLVGHALGDGVICDRCGATLDTYGDACTAALDDPCPGFMAVENALPAPLQLFGQRRH
jgi:hypothetical protein